MPQAGTTVLPSTINQLIYQAPGGASPEGIQFGPALDANGQPFKEGFYGTTPAVQPSGNQNAAITRGQQAGSVGVLKSATVSPSAVGTLTTAEQGITIGPATADWQVGTADLLYINKPTAQAGLGVGNVRVSAANVAGVTFSNFTSATITPTASQSYGFVALKGFMNNTATLTPAAVAPNTIAEQQFAVTGIRAGELVQVNKPTAQAGLDIVGCRAVSSNVLGITFANVTAATITPTAAEVYAWGSLGGIDAIGNEMLVMSLQSPGAVTNAHADEQGLTVTGLATTDTVTGVSKPTAQATLGIVGYRVSAANTLGVTFGNFSQTTTVTPTASESYAVAIKRPNPVAPLVVQAVTLTPAAVAPNTTAEQTFAVANVVASSAAWVNKPSATAGLGIAGVRVSAAGTIAINFCNATAGTITPPSEVYLVGNFQVPLGDASSGWVQPANAAQQSASVLANAIRSGLVATGLNAGA